MLHNTFYCIQPIYVSHEALDQLSEGTADRVISKNYNKFPLWKIQIDKFYQLFSNLAGFDVPKMDLDVVKRELLEYSDEYGMLDLTNLDTFLLYDHISLQYNIIFSLDVEIDNSWVLAIKKEKGLLYNLVRKIFVRESDDCVSPSNHISIFKSETLKLVLSYTREMYKNIKVTSDDFQILNNTGNITNVVYSSGEISKDTKCNISEFFVETNQHAERFLNTRNRPFLINSPSFDINKFEVDSDLDGFFIFGGRFHTIFISDKKDEYRFLPLQFYLQSIWFALSKQFDFLLQDEKHLHKIRNLDKLFSSLIEFKTQAEKLKMSLEHDIEVYRKIESRWNIESTFSHFVNKASLFESRQKNDIKLLKKALYTDTLTRAYTRNWLYDVVLSNGVFSECGALCVIDLDDFKIINDTLGHSTGDDVLKFFASVLLSSCQNTIRYGGDEFIVCYNSLHEAQRLVKLVRDEITGKDFITKEGRIIKLKFSCGFVGYSSGEAFEDVFTRADEKLYLDKEHKHTR